MRSEAVSESLACYHTQPETKDDFRGVKHEQFSYSPDVLRQLVADGLRLAKEQGASGAEIDVSEGFGLNVTVRKGEVETIEHNRDKGFGATVYFGQRRGHASSSDMSPQALRDTLTKACSIARHTAEDPFAGLPDEALLLRGELLYVDLGSSSHGYTLGTGCGAVCTGTADWDDSFWVGRLGLSVKLGGQEQYVPLK